MASVGLLDRPGAAGLRQPCPGFTRAACRANKGLRYPPDPPTVEEIIAVMRAAGDGPEGVTCLACAVSRDDGGVS
jgi:hypothetical protein